MCITSLFSLYHRTNYRRVTYHNFKRVKYCFNDYTMGLCTESQSGLTPKKLKIEFAPHIDRCG